MTQFECSECGQMARFMEIEQTTLRRMCPVCESETRWTIAFDASSQGVSF
jgi:Zn finger protein HypA/HybF involved in hydrogenase expression